MNLQAGDDGLGSQPERACSLSNCLALMQTIEAELGITCVHEN